jgi:hypothetical protein
LNASRSEHFVTISRQRDESFDLKRRLEAIEQAFVEDALEDTLDANGMPNQTKAADLLGISQLFCLY